MKRLGGIPPSSVAVMMDLVLVHGIYIAIALNHKSTPKFSPVD